ncbi:uncharacterized protein EAF01_006782 [Botrytis porri]|uniref:uncharacterized protein n=1 Tax=Botrytis porri TaxID=87229 RepID=UPI001901D18B|nr:uncharacterized protein EAF01_006782 [Botrytis porri]KAF7903733.1 hypothetical protein EAF01_006782 [Botrytis porri]
MSGLLDTTRNFSLYSVPAAWLLAHLPHVYAVISSKCFDNRSPRDFKKSLEDDQTLDKAKKNKIRRAHAAGANGYESIGFFASAVVAGNVAGLSHSTLNTLTGGYLISRAVYNFIYINNETQGAAGARSLAWLFGIGQIVTLFIKSGNALTNKAANLL